MISRGEASNAAGKNANGLPRVQAQNGRLPRGRYFVSSATFSVITVVRPLDILAFWISAQAIGPIPNGL